MGLAIMGLASWDWHHAIVTMGLAMYLRYPTPESASSMAHCSDSTGKPPVFQALGEHNFSSQPVFQEFVKTNIIPTNESDSKASAARPESFLVVLFVLSPTLWLVVFLACYLSARISGAFPYLFRASQYFQGVRVATLFPDGSPTSRPTFPR
jgi:hypothetical protein